MKKEKEEKGGGVFLLDTRKKEIKNSQFTVFHPSRHYYTDTFISHNPLPQLQSIRS